MTNRIRLLSSTALWTSLAAFAALHLTASSPAFAEEDAVCQLTNTYAVKAPPELCRTLGGVPSTTEVDVSDALYDIWNENNRTDRDKAYAAATAYLTSFPNGSRAEELRRWSAAYEKVMALSTPREVPRPTQPEVAQPPQTETAAVDAAAAELAAWQSIERSRNPADFHAFIERYPDGEFTPSARRRLSRLEAGARARQLKPSVTPDGTRSSEPERGNEPPLETILIDGQTYIKGREPKNIGTVPLQAPGN